MKNPGHSIQQITENKQEKKTWTTNLKYYFTKLLKN